MAPHAVHTHREEEELSLSWSNPSQATKSSFQEETTGSYNSEDGIPWAQMGSHLRLYRKVACFNRLPLPSGFPPKDGTGKPP